MAGSGDPSLLLDAADVPPVHEAGAGGRSPFLLACDHYGRLVPRALGDLGLAAGEFERHIAWDVGIAGVADALSKRLGAHLIAQRYSRLVIDCNRPRKPPARSRASARRPRSPATKGWPPARPRRGGRRSSIPITAASTRRSAAGCGTTFRPCWWRCHSFTPVYAGVARPWHIGTLYHRDTRLPPLLLKYLRAEGDLVVGDNEPYAVTDDTDYTIPVHGESRGLMNSGIEIRQDLIAAPAGQQQWADRLARVFGEIETTLRAQGLLPG